MIFMRKKMLKECKSLVELYFCILLHGSVSVIMGSPPKVVPRSLIQDSGTSREVAVSLLLLPTDGVAKSCKTFTLRSYF